MHTLHNISCIVTLTEVGNMNKGWNNYTIIYFGVSTKLKINSFLSWYKLINIVLNKEIVKCSMLSKLSYNRIEKVVIYSSLYFNFLKLNLQRYYNYWSKEIFVENLPFARLEILWLLKNSMYSRVIAMETISKIVSQAISAQKVLHNNCFPSTNDIDEFKCYDI